MKKTLISGLSIASLMLMLPTVSKADDLDSKIKEKEFKIEEITKNKKTADAYLAKLADQVAELEEEYNTTLDEKVKNEKELNDIQAKIVVVKDKIAKRKSQLETQARNAQVNSTTSAWLDIVTDSNSISDAVSKTIAMNRLVSQNNEVMKEQQNDEKELSTLEANVSKKVDTITEKTKELASSKESLTEAKFEQDIKVNEISAELTTEKSEKAKFVKQKEEAEKKRAEEMKRIAEEQKRQAAAAAKLAAAQAEERAKAQAAAQAAEEARQKAAAEQAEQEAAQATEAPETEAPQTEAPETEAPQTEAPATEAPQTEAPQTEAPQTEAPETEAPQTEAPQTEAPETEAPETEAPAAKPQSSGWANPLSGGYTITSGFGWRPDPNGASGNGHDGIDLAGTPGQTVMASRGGTVVAAEFHYSAGNHVIVQHSDGMYSYYMHLSGISVSVGQSVSQGQTVGLMGSTGNSTGTHLHFGISTGLWNGFLNPTGFVSL